MGFAEEAARLRELADEMGAMAELDIELAEAKAEYRDNLDDPKAKERHRKASAAIAAAREARRPEGTTIGGDAFQSNGNEG